MTGEYSVYALLDPRSLYIRYVGITKNRIQDRLKGHLSENKSNRKNNWIKQLKRNGLTPVCEEIESGLTMEKAYEAEVFFISYFKFIGFNLTNATHGGPGFFGVKHNNNTKRKISLKNKGHTGKDNGNYGKKRSADSRLKMSLSKYIFIKKNTKANPLIGEANGFYGKKHSDESKIRMSLSQKSAHISRRIFGKNKHSEETKMKIGLANKGKQGFIGELNCKAKLSESDVINIKEYCNSIGKDYRVLSEMYGVSYGTIYRIDKNKSWNHVKC